VFSIATLALTITATQLVYRAVPFLSSPFRLAIAASVYFVVNTFPIAIVISLTEGKSLRQVWSSCYFWCFPYYLVGAAIVSAFSLTNRVLYWQATVLILPVVYVVYRSYLPLFESVADGAKSAPKRSATMPRRSRCFMGKRWKPLFFFQEERKRHSVGQTKIFGSFAYAAAHDLKEPLRNVAISPWAHQARTAKAASGRKSRSWYRKVSKAPSA